MKNESEIVQHLLGACNENNYAFDVELFKKQHPLLYKSIIKSHNRFAFSAGMETIEKMEFDLKGLFNKLFTKT